MGLVVVKGVILIMVLIKPNTVFLLLSNDHFCLW